MYEAQRATARLRRNEAAEEWRQLYPIYLASDAWQRRRDLVLQRADFVCEGCRELGADEVHHLTYDHVGAEFLFDLVALCRDCHRRWHGIPAVFEEAAQ